jgi:DNA polymerase/3'-5' exonuclease PolX
MTIKEGRMPYAQALAVAERTRDALVPDCERIAIAGSIRRRKPQVKDIELVAIPRQVPTGLFGDEWVTDPDFCAVVNQWPAVKGRPEGKYTQRQLDGIVLDLFMADAENWGLIVAVRTGSAAFSHHILASGWVKAGYRSEAGRLRKHGQIIPVREEHDLFALIGLPWVEPESREV